MIKGFSLSGPDPDEPAHEDVALCHDARELLERMEAASVERVENRERVAREFGESIGRER